MMRINIKLSQILSGVILILAASSAAATPSTSYYIYDEAGHVIGEYDQNGNPVQEHVYLGDRPVAVVQNNTTLDYVTTDQLNTPRAITDSSGTVQWSWASDPFGNGQPTSSSLTYNLRFPGQYFDAETSHNYNYHRDYDPGTGRYIESDPTGLMGGLNTYVYVSDNPIGLFDVTGLADSSTTCHQDSCKVLYLHTLKYSGACEGGCHPIPGLVLISTCSPYFSYISPRCWCFQDGPVTGIRG